MIVLTGSALMLSQASISPGPHSMDLHIAVSVGSVWNCVVHITSFLLPSAGAHFLFRSTPATEVVTWIPLTSWPQLQEIEISEGVQTLRVRFSRCEGSRQGSKALTAGITVRALSTSLPAVSSGYFLFTEFGAQTVSSVSYARSFPRICFLVRLASVVSPVFIWTLMASTF